MIAEYREPKPLPRDAKPVGAFNVAAEHRDNAERGSAMLRDAILRSMGVTPIAPPKVNRVPRPLIRELAHIPEACPHCGAPAKPVRMLISHIQHTVAGYYGLDPSVMVSAQRALAISHPRQVAMYLASALTPKSLPEIGRRFGGRDHTTVIHAIKAVKKRMVEDAEILLDVEVLRERLAG